MTTPSEAIILIDAALASGELSIEYNGRRVTYRGVDDLLRARAHFERLRDAGDPSEAVPRERVRTTFAAFDDD